MNEFKRVTSIFDRLRGESLTELVPELSPLMTGTDQSSGNKLKLAVSQAKWLSGKIRSRLQD